PTGLGATQLSASQNLVSWSWQQTASQVGFVVERKAGSNGTYEEVGSVDGSGTYLDSGVVAGQEYHYRIYAVNAAGKSGYSAETGVINPNTNGNSMPVAGMKLWLMGDGAWETPVGYWHDYSGNGNHAWQNALNAYKPTLVQNAVNGKPAVHFDAAAAQSLNLPNLMAQASAGEVFVVVKADNITSNNGLWTFNGGGNGEFYMHSNGTIYSSFGSNAQKPLGSASQNVTGFRVYQISSQAGLWQSWIDGVPFYRSQSNTVLFSGAPVLGRNSEGFYFRGDIAELVIYDRALTDAERKSAIAYLDQKYAVIPAPAVPTGLGATQLSASQNLVSWNWQQTASQVDYVVERATDANGPFIELSTVNSAGSYLDTSITAGQVYYYRVYGRNAKGASAPTAVVAVVGQTNGGTVPVNGMKLWLRGDGVGASPVGYWPDYSGNGNDAWQNSHNQYKPTLSATTLLNGKPVVHFNAALGQSLKLPNLMADASAGEVFVVLKAAGAGLNNGLWTFNGGGYGEWYGHSNGNIYGSFGSNVQKPQGIPIRDITQFHIYQVSSQAGTWQSWINGTSFHQASSNTVLFSNSPVLGRNSEGYYFSGDIAELIVYNRGLSNDERQALLGYLTVRYQLGISSAFPPTFSSPHGSYTAPQDVTISAVSGASIHYTTDGTTPTQASQLYSAPLTLTHSTLLKARAFKEGFLGSDIASATYRMLK
ncbi:MAG: chitobiase/beta-hexosaminidase C-terminal domain-containing protein, partial [Verrucomicrobiota bacterium]